MRQIRHMQNFEKNGQLFATQSFTKSRTSLEVDENSILLNKILTPQYSINRYVKFLRIKPYGPHHPNQGCPLPTRKLNK